MHRINIINVNSTEFKQEYKLHLLNMFSSKVTEQISVHISIHHKQKWLNSCWICFIWNTDVLVMICSEGEIRISLKNFWFNVCQSSSARPDWRVCPSVHLHITVTNNATDIMPHLIYIITQLINKNGHIHNIQTVPTSGLETKRAYSGFGTS